MVANTPNLEAWQPDRLSDNRVNSCLHKVHGQLGKEDIVKLARGLQTPHVTIAGSQGPEYARLKSTEMRKKGKVGLFPEVDLSLETRQYEELHRRHL